MIINFQEHSYSRELRGLLEFVSKKKKTKTFVTTAMVSIYCILLLWFGYIIKRVEEEWGMQHEIKWSFRTELFTQQQ